MSVLVPRVHVQARFRVGDPEEKVCDIVLDAEAMRKIGFSPSVCEGGIEIPIEELEVRLEELLKGAPSPIISIECHRPRGGEGSCGDDLCFELPSGLVICPR